MSEHLKQRALRRHHVIADDRRNGPSFEGRVDVGMAVVVASDGKEQIARIDRARIDAPARHQRIGQLRLDTGFQHAANFSKRDVQSNFLQREAAASIRGRATCGGLLRDRQKRWVRLLEAGTSRALCPR